MNKTYYSKNQQGKTLKQIKERNLIDIADVVKKHAGNGGATFNVKTGENLSGKNLYAVSIYPDREQRINGMIISQDDILAFIAKNRDLFDLDNTSLGTWLCKRTDGDVSYLDVVVTVSKRKAIKLGRKHGQIAIFGLKNLETISLVESVDRKRES